MVDANVDANQDRPTIAGAPPRQERREDPREPVEFGWRVHNALESWTGRADLKASILLAFQGGAFIFGITFWDVLIKDVVRPWLQVALAATAVLVLAMVATAAVVVPVLGPRRRLREARPRSLVYFGHLRLWEPEDLARAMRDLTIRDETEMLSAQLIAMSRLTWRKHRLIQLSVALTVLALLLVTAVALTPHWGLR